MFENMDNFTPESLRSFLGKPPAAGPRPWEEEAGLRRRDPRPRGQHSGQEQPRAQQARTARAQRIGEVLESVGRESVEAERGGPAVLDAQIRQKLSELVRSMIEGGRYEELAEILASHRSFIEQIEGLLQQRRQSGE